MSYSVISRVINAQIEGKPEPISNNFECCLRKVDVADVPHFITPIMINLKGLRYGYKKTHLLPW